MYNFRSLLALGIAEHHAFELRRISMTLSRWHELECGDSSSHGSWAIVRGSKTGQVFEYDDDGKPFVEYHSHHSSKATYTATADRERGALKRLAGIMAHYPTLTAFVQTDPRGAALYVGEDLTDTNYNRGVAVHK
jgi:hypothetical protein